MGFNNGYDSGWDDGYAAARRRYEGSGTGDGKDTATSPKLPVSLLKGRLKQLVQDSSQAVLDTADYPLVTVVDGSFSYPGPIMLLCCIPAGQSNIYTTPFGADGSPGDFYKKPGLYAPTTDSGEMYPLVEWGDLSFDGAE